MRRAIVHGQAYLVAAALCGGLVAAALRGGLVAAALCGGLVAAALCGGLVAAAQVWRRGTEGCALQDARRPQQRRQFADLR